MAVYTVIEQHDLAELVADYGLNRLIGAHGIAAGSVNSNYLLETGRGKHLLRIDEVKSELDVKRELELLIFLRKHGFPCPQPIADRKGRWYREAAGKCAVGLPLGRRAQRQARTPDAWRISRTWAGRWPSSTRSARAYKKGIDNRFSFERIARGLRRDPRSAAVVLPAHSSARSTTRSSTWSTTSRTSCRRASSTATASTTTCSSRATRWSAVLDFEAACRGKFIFDLATAVNALCFDARRLRSASASRRSSPATSRCGRSRWPSGTRFPNELRFSALRFTVTRLRDFFLKPVDDGARVPQGLPRVLRTPAHPPPRTRGRHGGAAHGDGDGVRLSQVPARQGAGEEGLEVAPQAPTSP